MTGPLHHASETRRSCPAVPEYRGCDYRYSSAHRPDQYHRRYASLGPRTLPDGLRRSVQQTYCLYLHQDREYFRHPV